MMTDFRRAAMLPVEEARCTIEQSWPRLPDVEVPADPKVVAEGWERRFTADTERLAEYVELYTSLGYEVRAELVRPDQLSEACSDCRLIICRLFRTLYTRRRSNRQGDL